MSPPESWPASPSPPQFYPVEYHSEFGYLAPALSLRRKISLVGKGVAFGVLVGVIAVIALSPDRDARVRSVFHMQTQAAPGDGLAPSPVRFVAPTLAMRDVQSAVPAVASLAPAPAVSAEHAAAVAAVPAPAVSAMPVHTPPAQAAPAPREHKPAAKLKKKVARQPRRERNIRAAEPRPRSAHAGAFRRATEPRRDSGAGNPFSFGW